MKLQEVYDGWKNLLIPEEELKPHIERVSAARMNICNTCEFNSYNVAKSIRFDRHCTHCGCTSAAKTRSLISACPIGKWGAAVIDKQ